MFKPRKGSVWVYDTDYLNKLSKEELDWYNKFLNEFYRGFFNNNDTDLHKSKEDKRECHDRSNAARRDLIGYIPKGEKYKRKFKNIYTNYDYNFSEEKA